MVERKHSYSRIKPFFDEKLDYDVLFLDEPYKGLDEETRAKVMRLGKEHTRGKTVLLVTHDREEADGYEPLWLWANSENNEQNK